MLVNILILELFLYILGLCNTYMTNFSEYEAVRLASFERYLNIVLLQIWASFVIIITHKILHLKKYKNTLIYLSLVILFMVVPSKNIYSFLSKTNINNSMTVRQKYIPLHNEVKKYCEPKSNIYFISQWSNGFDYWVSRFNARPAIISTSKWGGWSIGKKRNSDDIWTASMGIDEWMDFLVKSYDYVAIYKTNNYFLETYSVLFSDEIYENRVYRVNKSERKLELCDE